MMKPKAGGRTQMRVGRRILSGFHFRPRQWRIILPLLLLAVMSLSLPAQEKILRVNGLTQVSRLYFRFVHSKSFKNEDLLSAIALTERGSMVGLRNFFSFVPMVNEVGEHPFDPLELQRDVVRLRKYYEGAGFQHTKVLYEASLDEEDNLIEITFVIDEGPPIILRDVLQSYAGEGGIAQFPAGVADDWSRSVEEIVPRKGSRLNLRELPKIEAAGTAWWRDHGYPFCKVTSSCQIDTGASSYSLNLRISAGPRTRIGKITVTGVESVRPGVVLRELPFAEGDPYSSRLLVEGRKEILSLGLFRRASVSIPDGVLPSDTVPIAVEVTESPPRVISGAGGYDSRGGLTVQAEWMHRNFTGDARTFSVSGLGQTGVWATERIPEILYRGTLTMTQPYVFHRRLSLVFGPLLEYRDDYRDKSTALGFTTNLIYLIDPAKSVTFRHQISDRRIEEARYGEYTSGTIDILTLLSNQAKGTRVLQNTFGILASYGDLDDMSIPREGYLLRPMVDLTFIPSLNSVQYVRFDLPLFGFYPVSEEFGFAARMNVGSVFPFGKGLPQGDETATEKFLELRDVAFTAGGSDDARGWGSRLLGPKFPDIRVTGTDPDTTTEVDGYIPLGGLSRISFSLEFRMPFPGLGKSAGIALYLDGARVWNATPEFASIGAWEDENRFFFGTGIGALYRLPVGTIRLDLGYKLNPSFQDLREASDVVQALRSGLPAESVPVQNLKRLHAHFSISVTF